MDADILRSQLEEAGEIMVHVEEFGVPLELHLHDTEIGDDLVTHTLSDGEVLFAVDSVTGLWRHLHSTDDYEL